MFCPKCKHEEEVHGQSGCTECRCTLKPADVHNYGHDAPVISKSEGRAIRRDLINTLLHTPNAIDIRQCVRAREFQLYGYELKAYAPAKEPECLMDVFEQSDEQGKIDMYAEALSNIEQLEVIITEQKVSVVELRQALIAKDQENEAAQNRIDDLEGIKIQQQRIDNEETLIVEIMALAYLLQSHSGYCTMLHFFGHTNSMEVSIRKSKEKYNEELFGTNFWLDQAKAYSNKDPLRWLKTKRDVLKHALEQGEIPYDEMERVVEEIVHYEF